MQIEIEISLFLNIFCNALILKMTGLALRCQARLWFLSALSGAVVALVMPYFDLSMPVKILLQVLVCLMMVCISFEIKPLKKLAQAFVGTIFSTFLFGGGCTALESLFGTLPLFVVAVICSLIYFSVRIFVNHRRRVEHVRKFTYNVTIRDGEKTIYEEGYLDSGNVLYDNITKKPIILVNFEVFHALYQNINFICAFTKNFDKKLVKNGHFVKINGIGGDSSILVFTIDELQVGNETVIKDASLGLSFSGFDKGFGKRMLLHSAIV